MTGFNKKELELYKQVSCLTESGLKNSMVKILNKYGYTVYDYDRYVIAEGELPVALVAHMDTVFSIPPHEFFYDEVKKVLWSPQGLGADDRAGIFAILQIIKEGYRPSIILTCGEERGGIGALELVKSGRCPFENLKYIIELDRQGTVDCVFYDCFNQKFIDYVESFGFVEAYGTFTDISILCPAWGIAGVNLSIGYRDEHSRCEILQTNAFKSTVKKVIEMLKASDTAEFFDYIPMVYSPVDKIHAPFECTCEKCHKTFDDTQGFFVENKDKDYDFVCLDCVDNTMNWCNICGEPYYVDNNMKLKNICRECAEEFYDIGPKITYPAGK